MRLLRQILWAPIAVLSIPFLKLIWNRMMPLAPITWGEATRASYNKWRNL